MFCVWGLELRSLVLFFFYLLLINVYETAEAVFVLILYLFHGQYFFRWVIERLKEVSMSSHDR